MRPLCLALLGMLLLALLALALSLAFVPVSKIQKVDTRATTTEIQRLLSLPEEKL